MKLVIICQYQESKTNRWACKGGETFVIDNLTDAQVTKINQGGIPNLKNLLEWGMDVPLEDIRTDFFSRQYVKTVQVVADDDNSLIEDWDSPWNLIYHNDEWCASRFEKAEDWWNTAPSGNPYEGKYEEYILAPQGTRKTNSYKEQYIERVAA